MNAFRRGRSFLAFSLVGAGICLLVADCPDSAGQKQKDSNSADSETVELNIPTIMVRYTLEGRFDEAVAVGLHALKNTPDDEVIYEQIADVYLIRAQKDPNKKLEWASDAVLYSDKALAVTTSDHDALGVHRFQIAKAYEAAGDISSDEQCQRYEKARTLLEGREPLLKSGSAVVEGKTVSLGPLRRENERALDEVTAKIEKSHCRPN